MAWHNHPVTIDEQAKAADILDVLDDARRDMGWQAYLNVAGSPNGQGGVEHASMSPQQVKVEADHTQLTATRAIASVEVDAGPADVATLATPYGTGIKAKVEVAEGAALSAAALVGSKVKTLTADTELHGANLGLALSLQASNKITILGADITVAGEHRRLARFTSQLTPIVDLGVGGAMDHFGVGLRLAGAIGATTTYEKFVPIDRLSAMMRQRAHWYRNGVETLAALGVAAGVRQPSMRQLAADMGQVDKMLPGESAMWKQARTFFIGLGGGSFGLRGTATAQFSGTATYKLERSDDGLIGLTVEPGKVKGLRVSGEAKLLADVSAEYIVAASHQRSWSFDLTMMSASQALAKALQGQLPGLMLPGMPNTAREAYALLSLMQAEKLPVGVTNTSAQFVQARALSLGIGSIRLPDVLGGSSLGASRSGSWTLAASATPDAAAFAQTHSRSSSKDLLMLGASEKVDSASLLTAVSIGPRGERISTLQAINTGLTRRVSDGGSFGRQRLVASVNRALGTDALVGSVVPSSQYTVKVVQTIGIEALAEAGSRSDQDLAKLAADHALPVHLLRQVRDSVAKATADGTEAGYARALAAITSHRHRGIRALHALGASDAPIVSVVNERHDQLLTDFFKAETYALGAKTVGHARHVIKRLEKLDGQVRTAVAEIEADTVMGMIADSTVAKRRHLLVTLQAEIAQMSADVTAALEACQMA